MKEEVIDIIREILEDKGENAKIPEINESSKLRDLGLSSFDLATLTVRIEDEYDVDIFEDGLVETVAQVVTILEENK